MLCESHMQLNLFQWDLHEAGKGYSSLARLDFPAATAHFSRVLKAFPHHQEARSGLKQVRYWEQTFHDLESMDTESGTVFLWQRVNHFAFPCSEPGQALQKTLFRRLLAMLEEAQLFWIPPDLCAGWLHLQLGDHVAAENHFRRQIQNAPGNGRWYGRLADALWMQGRKELANGVYVAALLLDPHRVAVDALCHRELAEVIEEHGPALAPAYGFLKRVLPLVEQEVKIPTTETRIYEQLRQAELAMLEDNYEAMVAARRELKRLSPTLFTD
jgi:tetratricopeptide (TPR) repeat protein